MTLQAAKIRTLKSNSISDKLGKSHFILIFVMSLFYFVAFYYVDLLSLTVWSTNIWDVLFDGRLLDYYIYSAENHSGLVHYYVGVEWIALLPWAVWNFPMWIISKLAGVNIASSHLTLLWSKLFLVVMLCFVLYYVSKIALVITKSKTAATWAVFITAGSMFTYGAVYYAGQTDIFFVLLGLIGIYELLAHRNEKRFLLFFALSLIIKPFYLFILIPILLLFEKNLLKILLKIGLCFGGLMLAKLLMLPFPFYLESLYLGPSIIELGKFLLPSIPIFGSNSHLDASIFITLYLLVCIFCYLKKSSLEDEKFATWMLYVSSAVLLIFSIFVTSTFYRTMMLVPILSLVIASNPKRFKMNMMFTLVLTFCIPIISILSGEALYVPGSMFANLDKDAMAQSVMVNYIPDARTMDYIANFFGGIALGSVIFLVFANYPHRRIEKFVEGEKCERFIIWIYTLLPIVFALYSAGLKFVLGI
ncbi:MAG: hypothetical protein LBL82_01255 [Oscillospiraceae bacterium]|jgi:hypothetical protein|nr:hypothetical protein [Oscillospiraceae bacterium]